MKPDEIVTIRCQCKSPDHVFKFTIDNFQDPARDIPPTLQLDIHLAQSLSFWERLVSSIKYLFKTGSDTSNCWDTVIVTEEQANQLFVLMHHFRVELEKFRKEKAKVN